MGGAEGRVYLDWNATAPLRAEARAAMVAALDLPANASSVHAEGRRARAIVEEARRDVARLLGAAAAEVTFTSGGTEANVTALAPLEEGRPTRLILSAVEHPSVVAGGRLAAAERRVVPVDGDGLVDLARLQAAVAEAVADGAVPLVALMLANNETGVLEPVAEAAAIVHAAGGRIHVDAVQAAGRIAVDAAALDVDTLSVSAHKLGGPSGVGALVVRRRLIPVPLISGGGQEGRRRAGTENVAGIAGFGAAARAAQGGLAEMSRVNRIRDWLEAELVLMCSNVVVFGRGAPRLPNTVAFAVPGVAAETSLMALDLDGISVSAGAACASGKASASPVLAAMGVSPDLARCAIRVSLGWDTVEADAARFVASAKKLFDRLGRAHAGQAA